MTTTELIDFLKKHERGAATGRPREITLTVNGAFMPCPHFYVDSTDDGLYTGICIGVSGDVARRILTMSDSEKECVCEREGLEKGDTLYVERSWDGGIEFNYISNIKYCPVCGKELPNYD